MYTIYEIPGVKIGVTSNLKRRQKEQLSKGELIVLEEYTDIHKASERELVLQRIKGYKVDKNPYWYTVKVQNKKATTIEAQKKRVANTDYKAMVANTDYKARTAKIDYKAIVAQIDYKAIMSHRQRGVIAIDPEGNRTLYSGQSEASRQLSKKLNRKVLQGAICNVLRVNHPAKQYLGYTFEHA